MKILGIDSSAKSASVTVTDNGKILSSFYINTGLTHSQTLMPMLDNALKCASLTLDDIDVVAVNKGPGSFTGIRIGVAAAKGIADTKNIKTIGISTLESMAYNLIGFDCIAVAVMDARCSQVYTALFKVKNTTIERLTDDLAVPISELKDMLSSYNEEIILVGDGADICYRALCDDFAEIKIAPEAYKYQNATGVCLATETKDKNLYVKSNELVPEYLRLPQAERELKNKLKKGE